MNDVLVMRSQDKKLEAQARRHGLRVQVLGADALEFDRALFVEPGVEVPWDLVGYGMHFLERWDAAAPLWRYGVLAQDVGTPSDRRRTESVIRDLRVLLYAHELLFVRGNPDGLALWRTWQEERALGDDARLAFLRALHMVKPRFCTLPRSWLREVPVRAAVVHRVAPRVADFALPEMTEAVPPTEQVAEGAQIAAGDPAAPPRIRREPTRPVAAGRVRARASAA